MKLEIEKINDKVDFDLNTVCRNQSDDPFEPAYIPPVTDPAAVSVRIC